MRTLKARLGVGLAAATMLLSTAAGASAADQATIDAAKQEGRIVWYTGLLIDGAVRPIIAAFEKKYPGITIDAARYAAPDILLRVQNEQQAQRYEVDVVDGTAAIPALINADFLQVYKSGEAADYAEDLKDPEGLWTAFTSYFTTAGYNSSMVSADEAPKTYEDLLDPKWKGAMAWPDDPSMIGPPGFIKLVLDKMGEEKGMEYLKQLATQNIAKVPASQRVVLDQVIAGQYALGLSTLTHHYVISQSRGAPVEWVKLDPLGQVVSTIGLVKNAPHPNAGKLLIDFILSEEGQELMREAGYIPTHPNVEPSDPSLKAETGGFNAVVIGATVTAKELGDLTKIYNDIFK